MSQRSACIILTCCVLISVGVFTWLGIGIYQANRGIHRPQPAELPVIKVGLNELHSQFANPVFGRNFYEGSIARVRCCVARIVEEPRYYEARLHVMRPDAIMATEFCGLARWDKTPENERQIALIRQGSIIDIDATKFETTSSPYAIGGRLVVIINGTIRPAID